jgi:tetraacyldisaccharide 4'-kinase
VIGAATVQSLEERIKDVWEANERTGGVLAAALRLLSLPYAAAVATRNCLYDRGILPGEKLPVPVISVGNLTVGGTGKTPTVILLANLLRRQGRRPAVLSRGYGGKTRGPVSVVSDGERVLREWPEAGDEPVLIARAAPGVPVLTGPQRRLTGRAAVERFGADCLILDDAFQHRALCRDLEIVLLDAARPLGNGFLLPRGPLREPPAALGRADLLLRTGGEDATLTPLPASAAIPSFRGLHRPQCLVEAGTGATLPLAALRGVRVAAFAGIGRPEAFRRSLSDLGAKVVAFRAFADHHPYAASDTETLRRLARKVGADRLVTTEKDAVRLAAFPAFLPELLLLRIGMEICPAEPFRELIFSRLAY